MGGQASQMSLRSHAANPRASRKRLRIIDLETGKAIQEIEDSELPESLTFASEHPTITDDASWLFPQGMLVASSTLKITWRADDVFPDFSPNTLSWIACANNHAASVQPAKGRGASKRLLVAELP